jgi:hypothetical protein
VPRDKSNLAEKYLGVTHKVYDADSRFTFIHGSLSWRRLPAVRTYSPIYCFAYNLHSKVEKPGFVNILVKKNSDVNHKHPPKILRFAIPVV